MVFPDEARLIMSLKAGNALAVNRWYRSSYKKLRAFFVSRVKSEPDVDELVQDTYLSCLKSLPLFRSESGLWGWMISIAQHELSDYWRRYYAKKVIRALPFGEDLLQLPSPTGELSDEHTKTILSCLPAELGELLARKYIDQTSVKELARNYGVSFEAMQSKIYRARQAFAIEYRKQFGQE